MANEFKEQRIIDNNKRTLVKYVYKSDASAMANSKLLDVSTLAYALNTTGQIMSSNTNPRSFYRIKIKRIFGQCGISANAYITLSWENSTNTVISYITRGNFDFNFDPTGDGAVIGNPDSTAANSGDILISAFNPMVNDTMTLFIDTRKVPEDYDQGQTAMPQDFNR